MLIWVLAQDGDLEAAVSAGERSVAICRDRGDETVLGATLVHLARAKWVGGDANGAAAAVREAILLRRSMPVPTTLARGIEQLAWIVATRDGRDDGERAAVLLGAGDRIWREFGLTKLLRTPMQAGPHSECETRVRADIGAEAFSAAFHRGAGMSIDEIIDYIAGRPPPTRRPATAGDPRDLLTRREREVAELLATGLTNHQIAESLVISRRTAESHVLRIMTKFGVTSRAQIAARLAGRKGPGGNSPSRSSGGLGDERDQKGENRADGRAPTAPGRPATRDSPAAAGGGRPTTARGAAPGTGVERTK
jgi:non-specific serine/threonine protein kinase